MSTRHYGHGNQVFADGHIELMKPVPKGLLWIVGTDARKYLDFSYDPEWRPPD